MARLCPPRDLEVLSTIAVYVRDMGWRLKQMGSEDSWCSGDPSEIKQTMLKARHGWEKEWESAAVKLGILEGKVSSAKKARA